LQKFWLNNALNSAWDSIKTYNCKKTLFFLHKIISKDCFLIELLVNLGLFRTFRTARICCSRADWKYGSQSTRSFVLLHYALSNATITFYAGRNDRGLPVVARCHERFTRGRRGTLRGLGRECCAWLARRWRMFVCKLHGFAMWRTTICENMRYWAKRLCELYYVCPNSGFRLIKHID